MPKTNNTPVQFTPLALAEITELADVYNVNEEQLLAVIAKDAERELSSAAMKHIPWFKAQELHNFHAARIRSAGTTVEVFMVVSPSERTVYSNVEHTLPDTYFAERVIEETRLEIKLGHLPS